MRRYYYRQEKGNSSKFCFVFAGLILLISLVTAFGVIKAQDGLEMQQRLIGLLPMIFVAIFVGGCGYVLNRQCYKFRAWHKYMRKNGTKCRGKVIEVLEERNVNISSETSRYTYRFRIEYRSKLKDADVVFITPALSFEPTKDSIGVRCDVYEVENLENFKYKLGRYMGEVIADDFDSKFETSIKDILKTAVYVIAVLAIMVMLYIVLRSIL